MSFLSFVLVIRHPIMVHQSLSNIKQCFVRCPGKEKKLEVLANLYGVLTIASCIVYCNVSMHHTHY